jgi:hypothetical protein
MSSSNSVADPYPFGSSSFYWIRIHGVVCSDPNPALMSRTKLNERGNLTFACCLAPGWDLLTMKIKLRSVKNTFLDALPL